MRPRVLTKLIGRMPKSSGRKPDGRNVYSLKGLRHCEERTKGEHLSMHTTRWNNGSPFYIPSSTQAFDVKSKTLQGKTSVTEEHIVNDIHSFKIKPEDGGNNTPLKIRKIKKRYSFAYSTKKFCKNQIDTWQ